MKEIWKKIPGYRGHFEVSNFGRVKATERKCNFNYRGILKTTRTRKERILATNKINSGYFIVHLYFNGSRRAELVHRLVLKVFIRNPISGETGNHKNFVKSDNRLENLEWISQLQNNMHKIMAGYGGRKLSDDDVRLIRFWAVRVPRGCNKGNGKILGRIFGVSNNIINNVAAGKSYSFVE
jgi:hypothetical protein